MKKITFLSLFGNTMQSDIRYIQHMFTQKYPDVSVSLMAKNIDIADKKKIAKAIETIDPYIADAENVFAFDGNVALPCWKDDMKADKRVLFMAPFDYLFEGINKPKHLNNVMNGFTDVIVPSKALTEYIKNNCDTSNKNIIGDVQIPLVEEMNDGSKGKELRAELENMFPWVKGKKIVSLLTSSLKSKQKRLFAEIKVADFIHDLPEDTILVVNNDSLYNTSSELDEEDAKKFIFIRRLFRRNDIAQFSDCVITDDAYLWNCCYAANKKVYYYAYRDSAFKKYAKKQLPSYVIKDLSKELHSVFDNERKSIPVEFAGTVSIEKAMEQVFGK